MTMNQRYPKAVRKALRELCALAEERELARHMDALSTRFDAWRNGDISAVELANGLLTEIEKELEGR